MDHLDIKPMAALTLALLAVCVAQPLVATQFEIVAATGVLEPDGLQAGQKLDENTRLALEPWGRALIRETAKCGLTHVVVGVSKYVLTLSDDCSDTEEPLNVAQRLQRGEVFVERFKETESSESANLVLALSNEPCVFLPRVSEEGNPKRQCPSGYAMRGVRCSGTFCDNKDLLCCPYLGGEPDPNTKIIQSRWISEEPPNSLKSKKFLTGLKCEGLYCDNVRLYSLKSSRLASTGTCEWSAWASERPGSWLDCSLGSFMTGIRCQADYCADLSLYCCQARVE